MGQTYSILETAKFIILIFPVILRDPKYELSGYKQSSSLVTSYSITLRWCQILVLIILLQVGSSLCSVVVNICKNDHLPPVQFLLPPHPSHTRVKTNQLTRNKMLLFTLRGYITCPWSKLILFLLPAEPTWLKLSNFNC